MNKLFVAFLVVFISLHAKGQELTFEKNALSDTAALALAMQNLAKDYLLQSKTKGLIIEANDRYMIEILAGDYGASIQTIESLRKDSELNNGHPRYMPYELYAKAKIKHLESGLGFDDAYQSVFRLYLANCNDEQAYSANIVFTTYDAVAQFANRFETNYNNVTDESIDHNQALVLLKTYFLFHVFTVTEPIVFKEIKLDENKRYLINEEVVVSPRDGAELSVITPRKRGLGRMPAVLIFTIYADASNEKQAVLAAAKGYVGVVATSRGKRLSKDSIEPYKHEYKDVYVVIDWISKQVWNNGQVGMYGGSYNGFTQWASMKEKVHPALKTIISSVSAAPGIDVPMENNIFFNFPYKWIPYVTNNKFLDHAANFDRSRWNKLENNWFTSGKAYHKMDSIDGTPSPVFQEWISHPSYDEYWQSMIPYKDEFSHINIPILTTTGYYDDGQRGAMYYYNEHLKYNPDAEHYLLIGPYDHWGAQLRSSANLRGYEIDSVATINIREGLVFEWFDYILKGEEKPAILQDKVNFQVMGTNQWISKPSVAEMRKDSLVCYLGQNKTNPYHRLTTNTSKKDHPLILSIDFSDRSQMNNADYYPWPIIKDSINLKDGVAFLSEPLEKETIINGSFSGKLKVSSNKKDFDFSINLYELTPEGKYFHLSYYIGRASYAESREHRKLLSPNKLTTITFDNTRIVSKKLAKGSKLVAVINGNKNPYGQINYGTGQDVSKESIDHATVPLELKIHTNSSLTIPVWNDK
jgi:putative CocE/NonD family hydrolase